MELIEKHIGDGWRLKNLIYIHRQCAYDIFQDSEDTGESVDLFTLLDGLMDAAPATESPYLELTEFFRLTDKTPLTLTFREIERILGEPLDWEAYFYEAFWYDDIPGRAAPLWRDESFPFQVFLPSSPDYCIADFWLSQGYKIKSLRLERERVVFRRTQGMSGLVLPKALTNKKLPEKAVYEAQKFFSQLIKKYGL